MCTVNNWNNSFDVKENSHEFEPWDQVLAREPLYGILETESYSLLLFILYLTVLYADSKNKSHNNCDVIIYYADKKTIKQANC